MFRRRFADVDKERSRTELSQRLVQALELYFVEEYNAYCQLDEGGDIQKIICLHPLSQFGDEADTILVTVKAEQLYRYMAVTETALVMKFDFTRYIPGGFNGWHDPARGVRDEPDFFCRTGIQEDASFASGALILRSPLTKEMIIAHAADERSDANKQYAVFKAWDWKNRRNAEISCAPSALASYFEKESALPFQTTPAFFKPEVLQKYKAYPEKYTLATVNSLSRRVVPQVVRC